MTSTEPTTQQRREAVDIGMRMAEKFQKLHGRPLPKDYIEFAGMLAVAFNLGRESQGERRCSSTS